MQLKVHLFDLDIPATCNHLTDFIRGKVVEMRRDGILVPFSGGLDSSTVLLLCKQAVGREKVKALLMPEEQGNPQAESFAHLVAGKFGIETITRDISPVLKALGVYDFILSRLPGRQVQHLTVKTYLRLAGKNPFLDIARGKGESWVRAGFALFNTKQRIRSVMTYLLAEEMNLLVAGCAHRTEDLLGLFVKFGVDDNADIMPLKDYYRTQILQIAAQVGVPQEILQRTPNPDIIPGVSDKYRDIIGLSSDVLDLILYGIEKEMQNSEIAAQLALPEVKVSEIRSLVEDTKHMRQPSQFPEVH